jgi:hypothetical protein
MKHYVNFLDLGYTSERESKWEKVEKLVKC